MEDTGSMLGLIIAIGLFLALFSALRQFFCWYWKINKNIELQETILLELKKLNGEKKEADNTEFKAMTNRDDRY